MPNFDARLQSTAPNYQAKRISAARLNVLHAARNASCEAFLRLLECHAHPLRIQFQRSSHPAQLALWQQRLFSLVSLTMAANSLPCRSTSLCHQAPLARGQRRRRLCAAGCTLAQGGQQVGIDPDVASATLLMTSSCGGSADSDTS